MFQEGSNPVHWEEYKQAGNTAFLLCHSSSPFIEQEIKISFLYHLIMYSEQSVLLN